MPRSMSAKSSTSSLAFVIGKTLDTAGRLLSDNAERHLRSPREMQQLFYDYPEPSPTHASCRPGCNLR